MSDIALLIEEAADKITENERKQIKRKRSYSDSELKEMLAEQTWKKAENRRLLSEKLNALCERARKEFNLSSVPTGMMEEIATNISREAKAENIKSIIDIDSNRAVTATINREATKVQIIENYEAEMHAMQPPHENVACYIEPAKFIASTPENAEALNILFEVTAIDKENLKLVNNMTLENADEISRVIQDNQRSEAAFNNRKEQAKARVVLLQSPDEEEKRAACVSSESEASFAERRVQTFDEQRGDRKGLTDPMQSMLVEFFSKYKSPEQIALKIASNIISDAGFTPEEKMEMKALLDEYGKTQDDSKLKEYFANKIQEVLQEYGVEISVEEIMGRAEALATGPIDPKRIDMATLREEAKIRFPDEVMNVKYNKLIKQIYALPKEGGTIDWEFLEEVHENSPELYQLTLRALCIESKDLEDKSINGKAQELIEEFGDSKKIHVMTDIATITRELKSQSGKKTNYEGTYMKLAIASKDQDISVDDLKVELLEQIRTDPTLTYDEAKRLTTAIEDVSSKEDFVEFALDEITLIHKNNGDESFDRNKRRAQIEKGSSKGSDAYKRDKKTERDQMNRKAYTVLTQGEYEKFAETMILIRDSEYDKIDLSVLDCIQVVDQELYEYACSELTHFGNGQIKDAVQKRRNIDKLETKKREAEQRAAEDKSQDIDNAVKEAENEEKAEQIDAQTAEMIGEEIGEEAPPARESEEGNTSFLKGDASIGAQMTSSTALVKTTEVEVEIGDERE